MNHTFFIYNFSKIYIPAVLILCLFYASFGQFSKAIKEYQPKATDKLPHSQSKPERSISPQITQKKAVPSQIRTAEQPDSVQPQFNYLVEFTSGKSMTVDDVKLEENLVHFIIQDGYKMTMSKSEIKSIKRFKL